MIKEQDVSSLRRGLSTIALGIRSSRIESDSVDKPFSSIDYDFFEGERVYRRKKIILAAPGCTAATCTMCPIPNESFYGKRREFTPDDFLSQFNSSFAGEPLDNYQLISVYNSGNWFANREIPPEARQRIYLAIADSQCEGLMVESLPQFITPAAVDEARKHLENKRLIVGIGLQSADDFIRNVCINTTCTKSQFERATRLLWENGYTPKVYLMIKPPFLTEREAIEETVNSVKYVSEVGYEDVSICPTRIAPHTVVAELAKKGMFEPPSLWTVINILKRVEPIPRVRVACLDVDGKDMDTIYPRNCETCTPIVLEAIKNYNTERDLSLLEELSCGCKKDYQEAIQITDIRPVQDRVRDFIYQYHT
jgi:radical SAM enzyme (TIGR01210 family)